MDPQRSKKSRSLSTDVTTSSRQSATTTSAHKKSDQADKHHSVPVAARRRQSDSKRASEVSRVSDKSKRTSKASAHDGSSLRVPGHVGEAQETEQQRNSATSVSSNTRPADRDEIPILTFAVVGNSKVGKSVFIRNALDLRRPSTTQTSTSKVLLGGLLYRLQLAEVSLDSVDVSHDTIVWPSLPELGAQRDVDGVLCLYDVSDRGSLEGIAQLLTALEQTDKTTCLVSCKVDIPLCDQQVGPSFIDHVSTKFPRLAVEEASIESSDSAKRCLLKILRETLTATRRGSRLPSRPRSESNDPLTRQARQSSQNASSRSRSGSRRQLTQSRSRENLLKAPPPPVIESDEEDDSDEDSADEASTHTELDIKMPLRIKTADYRSKIHAGKLQTPISSTENISIRASQQLNRGKPSVPQTPESFIEAAMLRRGSADTADSQGYKTFLDIDDESAADDASPVEAVPEKPHKEATSEESVYEGSTLAELVDRLLAMPTSKGDHKFITSFLCLYRAFATPMSLLMLLVDRFVTTEGSDMVVFTKTAELLRYLSVLGLWTTHYPGDFADSAVREAASSFLTAIERTKSFAPAAKQIANNLQTNVPDEDKDWAFAEGGNAAKTRKSTSQQGKLTRSESRRDTKARQRSTTKGRDGRDSDSDENLPTSLSARHSATTSSASSLLKSSQVSSQTSDNLHNLETARERAKRLRIVPQTLVSKLQWHQFMSFSTDELAIEITRIDWTMYTAIRPRDFVRYVTVPTAQRSRPGHIDYIGMMTKHFNHLALFISGMILVRDKPKHRAKMLERFMDLAWKVRQMNNYHALGAIVAALNSEEIVRLVQTHELVPQEHHKQFLRLKVLMGHQKSHAAYRMAWDNSSAERIPYLPRIQEDLTKAAMGNPTFVGGRVNWKKFEIMGETIVSVQRSQEQPYNFSDRTARGHDIDRLILGTKVLEGNEDTADPQQELYERSKFIEPPSTSGGASEKKMFDWLRR